VAALRFGTRAPVQKRFAIETLMTAIQAVLEGNVWMLPALHAAFTQQDPDSRKRAYTPRVRNYSLRRDRHA
jgi:DNA-binding NarL/FixJ family response regulator